MFNRIGRNSQSALRRYVTANHHLVGTSSLIEDDVYDTAGNFLGEIEEIVLDTRIGCVRYAVLAHGGFGGSGRAGSPSHGAH
jgi:sporulation protein YlmC with PRC-barrel domain